MVEHTKQKVSDSVKSKDYIDVPNECILHFGGPMIDYIDGEYIPRHFPSGTYGVLLPAGFWAFVSPA